VNTTVMERDQKTRPTPQIVVFRDRLVDRKVEIEAALAGSGISVDRFIRTAVTAASNQAELLSDVSFQSLWLAIMQACRDGLLPDGRQGALVPYKKTAKWIPMYHGLIDRFQQSGEFRWIGADLHRDDDIAFDRWLDETGQHFLHRPGPGNGKVLDTYAAATTKSGGFFVTVINENEMTRIRNVSRAKGDDSPWAQWTDQMRLKTALRRLCKLLPVPQPLEDLVNREDEEAGEAAAPQKPAFRPRTATPALTQAEPPRDLLDETDTADTTTAQTDETQTSGDAGAATQTTETTPVMIETAIERGKEAKRTGMKRAATPGEYREPGRIRELEAWQRGWDGGADA
jgi:recombination protein RecT